MKSPSAAQVNYPDATPAAGTDRGSRRPWSHWLNPNHWSVTAKITTSMLALAVIPAGLVASYNLYRGIETVERTELKNLELLAISSSSRLDQLIVDTKRVVVQMSQSRDVIDFLSAPPETRSQYDALVTQTLENFRLSSTDYELTYLLDAEGNMVAIPAFPDALGKNYTFRDYYRVPKEQGEAYASTILLGTTTDEPGLYFSAPVYDAEQQLIGVAVLKMSGTTIWDLVDDVKPGNRNNALELDDTASSLAGAFLVDKYGVIIAHPNRDYLYRSLDDLPPELMAQVERDRARNSQAGSRLYGRDIESQDIPELAAVMVNPENPGDVESGAIQYYFPAQDEWKVMGYAPLENQDWVMGVFEPREYFRAPLEQLRLQNLITVSLVGGMAAAIALLLARGIVRPLRTLTESARRMAADDFNPQLITKTEQTLKQLSQERRLVRFLQAPLAERDTLEQSAQVRLDTALQEIPEGELIAVLDQEGVCRLATQAHLVGQSYQLEPYFREALQGSMFVAKQALHGTMVKSPGLYFSAPLPDPTEEELLGVIVVVLKEKALYLADLITAADRPDDLGQLSAVFMRMASQVKVREERLKQQVTELKIEIDQSKKAQQVAEITESDYFQSLQAKARVFRGRGKSSDTQPTN